MSQVNTHLCSLPLPSKPGFECPVKCTLYYDWTFGGITEMGESCFWDSSSQHTPPIIRNLSLSLPFTSHFLTTTFQCGCIPQSQPLLLEHMCTLTGTHRGFGGTAIPMYQNDEVGMTQSGSNWTDTVTWDSHRLCLMRALVHFYRVYLLVCSSVRGEVNPHNCSALVWCKRVWRFACSVYNFWDMWYFLI